ncbi:hypothetical protein [Streptomyces sp. SD15]
MSETNAGPWTSPKPAAMNAAELASQGPQLTLSPSTWADFITYAAK